MNTITKMIQGYTNLKLAFLKPLPLTHHKSENKAPASHTFFNILFLQLTLLP